MDGGYLYPQKRKEKKETTVFCTEPGQTFNECHEGHGHHVPRFGPKPLKKREKKKERKRSLCGLDALAHALAGAMLSFSLAFLSIQIVYVSSICF